MVTIEECHQQEENHLYIAEENVINETLPTHFTIRGEKEKENKKEKQQQKTALYPSIEYKLGIGPLLQIHSKTEGAKGVIGFWDAIGLGVKNGNVKKLLSWFNNKQTTYTIDST
ncbi:hypothetical protein [Bacillus sp. FJAT-27251]|uniref:hypothetical protein n=1 Tax=Bacillus sp. FJAT-27251 TaxID=1684142 RepID=UPI0006A7A69C|nr:hypothetical protein [Bacillus sp. FJAT-27251]